MMRTILFVIICLGLFLILSPLSGCGDGEEPPQQEASALSEPQTEEEQKEVPPQAPPLEMETKPETEPVAETVIEAEVSENSDEIVIENRGYENDKKKPVKLSHKKHSEEYEITCNSCHHVYQKGENVWKQGDPVEKCVACHDPVEDQDNVIKLQSAFHRNCRDCHKEVTQEGKEAPYKKCTDCHG